MKKSLIAVAVAGLFAAPVAMAEVTLSGAINIGIEYSKSSAGTGVTTGGLSKTQLNRNYSHIDIESVDDIGGGNKVIFHYQIVASPQALGPAGDLTNRNSFLGVAGGWGAFKMGTNENVYERFMYTADPLDGALGPGGNLMILGTPGFNTAFDVGQAGGGVGFYRRTDHTIWYESPNYSGFAFEVDYTLSAFKTNAGTTTFALDPKTGTVKATTSTGANPQVLSIGGKFQPEGAPFYVDVAYEKHDDFRSDTSKDTGVQIGGGYMIGDLGLHLRYEQLKYQDTGFDYKRNAIWFGVKYNLPSGYVGAELGSAADGTLNGVKQNNTGAKMFGVGYFHNLSKQSQLQFIYGRTDNKDNASYTQASAPLGNAGSDHQVLHVGLKHTY